MQWERKLVPIGRGGTILYKWVQLKERAGSGESGGGDPAPIVSEVPLSCDLNHALYSQLNNG